MEDKVTLPRYIATKEGHKLNPLGDWCKSADVADVEYERNALKKQVEKLCDQRDAAINLVYTHRCPPGRIVKCIRKSVSDCRACWEKWSEE